MTLLPVLNDSNEDDDDDDVGDDVGDGVDDDVNDDVDDDVDDDEYGKGDHRKLKINRLTLDYVFLNKYTIKMKQSIYFLFLLI